MLGSRNHHETSCAAMPATTIRLRAMISLSAMARQSMGSGCQEPYERTRSALANPTEKARHQIDTVVNPATSTSSGISYCWFPLVALQAAKIDEVAQVIALCGPVDEIDAEIWAVIGVEVLERQDS